uniref:Interleukin 6 receptor n=1 Tax=Sphenodon punctatus TaxID=8508 RepID=A0A8D0GAP0_SPHPU
MRTRARLWVRKGLMGETPKEQPCRYFPKTQKFTCRLSVQPGNDETSLLVFLCVGNAAGSAASKSQLFKANHVLKPDAPVNVSVEAVERAPHKLQVTWRYPLSWVSRFYRLRFQLRYRAEVSHTHSEVSQLQETSYLILDAWRGQRHHIQVRGLEEFGYGSWSEWSKEATGIPWTDPSTPESETLSYTSQFATDDSFCEDNALFLTPVPPSGTEAPAAGDPAGVLRWTFCVAACTLAVGIALFTGIVIRYRRKWHPSSPREGKAAAALQYSLVPLAPASPTSAAPLLPCPASPCSTSSGPSPGSTASSPCHLANVDYFLMPR